MVNFHQVYALPYAYLVFRAGQLSSRYRVKMPYVQDLSQRFGLVFSRVALPEAIRAPR